MTLEQASIAALGVVCTALCFLFNLLRVRSELCERWRAEKEPIITEMAERLGVAQGVANFVNACDIHGCPFKGKIHTSYSLQPKDKRHELHPKELEN